MLKTSPLQLSIVSVLATTFVTAAHADSKPTANVLPANRVATVMVSQDFLNEQLSLHIKSPLIKEAKLELDHETGRVYLRGIVQVPLEEMRAVNLDPKLGAFRFQAALKLEATKQGHLLLDFPINETYFYPATSRDPKGDRIVVPVQLLSLILASARGYISALSGDFSGFDRRTVKLEALKKDVERSIAHEKNPDALSELKNQRESLRLQLAAVPVERKQLEAVGKEFEHILGFTGEKEINLNDELAARRNSLVLKIKLAQLTPYLKTSDLGGIRIVHDKKDGTGENYMAIDINSEQAVQKPDESITPSPREPMKIAPAMIMRLNQSLLESKELADVEKEKMGSNLRSVDIQLKDDGLHISGIYHKLILNLPFETTVDFVSTAPDVFEARVRKLDVAGLDLEFLEKFALEAVAARLELATKGACDFKYIAKDGDHPRALRVTANPAKLVPAFPDLHLMMVDVRDKEFLLKIGHEAAPAPATKEAAAEAR